MSLQLQFPSMATAIVARAEAHLGVNGRRGVKRRKVRADRGCIDCGRTDQQMKTGTTCRKCASEAAVHRTNTTVRGIVSRLVRNTRTGHMQKNNGSADGFDVTVDKVLQKIIELNGYCGISRVVPLSFNKQSPFLMSIEDLPGTPPGYHEDGWTVCIGLFNVGSQPITADFEMLGQCKVEYSVTDVARPVKTDVRPIKPDDGREWVICSMCWGESTSGTRRCKDCKSWYDQTMNQKLSKMVFHGKAADKRRKRPAPVDLSKATLRAMLEAQDYKCAVSGLPFARGVKQGERYAPFAISCDRLDNDRPHDLDNVRLVCALFNPVDGNRKRASLGVHCPPEGTVEPYSYSWTKNDYEILARLCRERWGVISPPASPAQEYNVHRPSTSTPSPC